MTGFEPATPSLPWRCSTTELHWQLSPLQKSGAGDETRTRDPQLGRLMLYQLSYSRISRKSIVGVIGIEPIQHYTLDLQSSPALQLRRTPSQNHRDDEPMEGFEPPAR